jgi:acetyl-CoA carboxylase carboxyltransferase component
MSGMTEAGVADQRGHGVQIAELERRRAALRHRDPEAILKVRDRGLLTAQERVDLLLDPGSEWRYAQAAGPSPVHLAIGTIHGRPVVVKAHDFSVRSGVYTTQIGPGMRALRHLADRGALPVFQLFQGGGGTINTRAMSSAFAGASGSVGAIFASQRRGTIFTAVLGNAFAPWAVAASDFATMSRDASATFVSPFIVEHATGRRPDIYEMGGAEAHSTITGQIDRVGEDEAETIQHVRTAFSYLPSNHFDPPPRILTGDPPDRRDEELRTLTPAYPNRPYDVRKVIERVVDKGSFMEWLPDYATNMVIGLARLDGYTVAIGANQPKAGAGTVSRDAMLKFERLLRCADSFGLPLVTFTDTPGVLTTMPEEHKGILAQTMHSSGVMLRLQVPRVGVVIGKGIGFGYFYMGNSIEEGMTFCWPQTQIAYLGAEGGASVVHRRKLREAEDPRSLVKELAKPFREGMNPWRAARMAVVDNVIDPADTRLMIIRALDAQRGPTGAPP